MMPVPQSISSESFMTVVQFTVICLTNKVTNKHRYRGDQNQYLAKCRWSDLIKHNLVEF